MKKAVAYIRVSSSGQEDNTSLDNQLNKIKLTCQLEDLELVKVYKEIGSGKDIKKRKELNQLLLDIDNYDTVIVYRVDRLSRSLINAVSIIKKLLDSEKNLISVSEKFSLDSAVGRLQFNMIASFAEYEREVIAERLREGKKETIAKGGFIGGITRLGYKAVPNDTTKSIIIKDDTEYKVVETIKRHRHSGKSFNEIAEYLNKNDFKTKKGKKFSAMQVKRVLDYEKK